MVICPRCAQQVDETTRTTCPHCFTPLSAAGVPALGQDPPAQPYPGAPGQTQQPQQPQTFAPQLSRSAGTRVSLTGEVIEDDAASAPPPSYVGGGAPNRPPVGVASRPPGPASSRPAYSAPRAEAPAKSGGSPIVAILIGLVVLGGLGAGGWWFLTPHSNPKTVVLQFDKAVAAQDWAKVYTLMDLPADIKRQCPDSSSFVSFITTQVQEIRTGPVESVIVDAAMKSYQTATVGEPSIDGDSAKVPVTLNISLAAFGKPDRTVNRPILLNKVNGVWKIDGSRSVLFGGLGSGRM